MSVAAGDRKSLADLIRTLGVPDGGYAVVVPGATYGSAKSWPDEKYQGLVEKLSSEIPVVLGGSTGESELCAMIGEGRRNVFNLAGRTSLGEFVALLGGARVVVANDSGSPHVAASLGVPVVVIFGSTSPTWTTPLGEHVHVIIKPTHCSPCFLRECPTRLECYENIGVEEVFETAKNGIEKNDRG
jgi:heptosyltransferase-2